VTPPKDFYIKQRDKPAQLNAEGFLIHPSLKTRQDQPKVSSACNGYFERNHVNQGSRGSIELISGGARSKGKKAGGEKKKEGYRDRLHDDS